MLSADWLTVLTGLGLTIFLRTGLLGYVFNPFNFQPKELLMWYGIKLFFVFVFDGIMTCLVKKLAKPTPFRSNNKKVKGLVALQPIDFTYLALNSVVEFVYIQHIISFVFLSGKVHFGAENLSVLNTPVAFYLAWFVNDAMYAPAHRFMHWPPVYPLVHKHHHRQLLPHRGYFDAANEHPVEQIIGLSLLLTTYYVLSITVGLHIAAVIPHFVVYGVLSMMNHSGQDVSFTFLGLSYSVRAHEMHHRLGKINMGQHLMVWDRLMGTYKEYQS